MPVVLLLAPYFYCYYLKSNNQGGHRSSNSINNTHYTGTYYLLFIHFFNGFSNVAVRHLNVQQPSQCRRNVGHVYGPVG